jgi:hypothetical protein
MRLDRRTHPLAFAAGLVSRSFAVEADRSCASI